jgi:helix-turn-helix protein
MKYTIFCQRGEASMFGAAGTYLMGDDGEEIEFSTVEDAEAKCAELNSDRNPVLRYWVEAEDK